MSRRGDASPSRAAEAAAPAPAARLVPPLGQGVALQRQLRAARALRLHHALVIGGDSGTGKSTIARWLAGALLCPSELADTGPCGQCRTCRKVASGQHADLHLVQPAPERREIAVDAVRELLQRLQHLPVEGRARVAIVDPASALNDEGQNALLKTLEEPGQHTFVLLPTSRPEALLPTVHSRCQRLGVLGLDAATLTAELSRRGAPLPAHHAAAVRQAQGSLGRALAACTEQAVNLQDLVLQVFAVDCPLRPLATARAALAGEGGAVAAQQRARTFLAAVRAHASANMRALAPTAGGSYLRAPEPWTTLLELTLAAEQDLDLQIPAEQALCGLVLQWQRARRRG